MSVKYQEFVSKYDKFSDIVSKVMVIFCASIFAVMILSVSYGVLGRYLPFVKAPRWTQELAILCLIWLCFASAGYGIKEEKHTRMTFLINKFPPKVKMVFDMLSYVLLFAVSLFWVVYGIRVCKLSSTARMAATGWPMSMNYISLVIGGVYGVLMTIDRMLKGGLEWK